MDNSDVAALPPEEPPPDDLYGAAFAAAWPVAVMPSPTATTDRAVMNLRDMTLLPDGSG
jgi:hypothetical protein